MHIFTFNWNESEKSKRLKRIKLGNDCVSQVQEGYMGVSPFRQFEFYARIRNNQLILPNSRLLQANGVSFFADLVFFDRELRITR